MSAESRTVHLVSQEGEQFDVSLDVAKMSELVKTMFDDDQGDDEIQEIPLPNVKTIILAKVIEFAEHYKIEPMTEITKVKLLFSLSFSLSLTSFFLSFFSIPSLTCLFLAIKISKYVRSCSRMVCHFCYC
jgi:hypothetical protein